MSLHYVAQCSSAQQLQRYEDVLLQAPAPAGDCCSRSFSCWALFDGHNGDTVARFLGSSLLPELESRLPAMPLPQEEPEQYVYADAVRRAVTAAFLSLSLRVCELTGGTATGCGSAAAVVVQTGHLLTVANAGSSKCVLDVGHCAIECSADHRLGNNEDEEERLDAAGAYVARLKFDLSGPAAPGELGCGPLRLWPGGLHMSRAIGDNDCGQLVIPHPYIQQMWLPHRPSRLIMANGGMWDVFESWQKAASALRGVSLQNAASALLQRALKRKQHRADRGDMSVLVVDFCPESCSSSSSSFKSQTRLERVSLCSVCSSNCSSHGISTSASSLITRHSMSSRTAATKLSLAGMQQVHPLQQPQQLQQQQHKAGDQLQGSCKVGSPSPLLTPCSSSKSLCSTGSGQQHQQVQHTEQQQPVGLLHRLLPVLCFSTGASAVTESGGAAHQMQLKAASAPSPGLQKQSSASSFLSSSDGGASASNPASIPASSSMQSTRTSSWHSRSSWRKSARAGALLAGQHPQLDPSILRIVARCDSFQAYCRGQYAPIEQQLAMLEASCGWSTLHPLCKQPSLQDTQQEADHLDSGLGADQLQHQRQQRVLAGSRKGSSAEGAAKCVSVGA